MVKVSKKKLEGTEFHTQDDSVFYDSFMKALAGVAILKGDTHIFEFANTEYERLVDRKVTNGKTVKETLPEIGQQGVLDMLNSFYTTGEPFIQNEYEVDLKGGNASNLKKHYLNLVVEPLKDNLGKTQRILVHVTDISSLVEARKQLELREVAMRQMASHLKLATESANVGTWTLDLKTQGLEWNMVHKKMWGYHENLTALTYEHWHAVISPKEKETALQKVEYAKRSGIEYDQSYYINRFNDGAVRYVRSIGKFYYNDSGEAHTLSGITIDNTEQKIAEQKIAESEKQLRTFADSIQNLAWIADGKGRINWYNQQWYDYTGTTFDEMKRWDWEKVYHPDYVQPISAMIKQLLTEGQAWELTFPIRRHDGIYRWFLTRAFPVKDSSGTIEKWIGTNTDITNQKSISEELENKVKQRTEALHIQNETYKIAEKIAKFGSYKWNMKTGYLEYSDNLFRLFDCEPQEFVPSFDKFLTFVHPDDLQQVISYAEHTMQTGEVMDKPYRIIGKTGATKYVSTMGNFIDDDGERSLIGVLQDITKAVADAEELKSKNTALENLNAELKSFTFIASHDLQEPLRKIQTFSKRIIEVERFSDKTQDYFNRIIAAGERMQNLIISLLDFSRADKVEFNAVPCDLNLIVEQSKNDLYVSVLEKQAIVKYEQLPIVHGMPVQLSQLFTNLIDNALKFCKPNSKPHIKITAKKIKGSDINDNLANNELCYYAIKIADNGIGFEKEYATKIFELFQRLHHHNEYTGTGIGLAIVKKIALNHNGFIIADGNPNKGATFTLYLPKIETSAKLDVVAKAGSGKQKEV